MMCKEICSCLGLAAYPMRCVSAPRDGLLMLSHHDISDIDTRLVAALCEIASSKPGCCKKLSTWHPCAYRRSTGSALPWLVPPVPPWRVCMPHRTASHMELSFCISGIVSLTSLYLSVTNQARPTPEPICDLYLPHVTMYRFPGAGNMIY